MARNNEGGEDGEAAACARVAARLRAEIAERETAALAREASRQLGRKLTVAHFRMAVAKHDAKTKGGGGRARTVDDADRRRASE